MHRQKKLLPAAVRLLLAMSLVLLASQPVRGSAIEEQGSASTTEKAAVAPDKPALEIRIGLEQLRDPFWY